MPNTPVVGVAAQRVLHRLPLTLLATLFVAGLWLSTGGSAASAAPNSIGLRATYDASAHIEWATGAMNVSSTATVTNTRPEGVNRLVFNLITLRTGDANIRSVTVGGNPVTPNVTGQTIIVTLPNALAPDEQIQVTIDYRARFNQITGHKRGLFEKKNGIATAYRWIPWLSREHAFATPNFGETWVTGNSPRVVVRLSSDAALKFATSGRGIGTSNGEQVFEAEHVRDFNFSMSPNYKVRKFTWNGRTIRIFNINLSRDTLITHARDALNRFTDRVGQYPYNRLIIAEVPSGTGMESPALVWISNTIGGSRLRHIIIHEVAHQYFYSSVGNNQALAPFADEALSDFLTRDYLGSWRASQCAIGRLDRQVYEYSNGCYPEVIYLQGAQYLRAYRDEVGGESFWAGIRRYYVENSAQIAGTRILLDTLDAESGYDSQRHAQRFPSLY